MQTYFAKGYKHKKKIQKLKVQCTAFVIFFVLFLGGFQVAVKRVYGSKEPAIAQLAIGRLTRRLVGILGKDGK